MVALARLVRDGTGGGKEWEIHGDELLGRGPGCKIRFDDPAVSREHCAICVADGRVFVQDLASANGTFVNGKEVRRAELLDGDVLTIGNVTIVVRLSNTKGADDPVVSIPLPLADETAIEAPVAAVCSSSPTQAQDITSAPVVHPRVVRSRHASGRRAIRGARRALSAVESAAKSRRVRWIAFGALTTLVLVLLWRQWPLLDLVPALTARSGDRTKEPTPAPLISKPEDAGMLSEAEWSVFKNIGPFVTAVLATSRSLWVGTEDNGLWHIDLRADFGSAREWKRFGPADGLPDEHVYALTEDTRGRLWVGSARHGVAVFNGKEWRTYGVLEGCPGERVFALAADPNPSRGDVWMGTDGGLGRYSQKNGIGCWRTYTRADGLPSDQVSAVGVDPKEGRVWIGTQCDGIAWADPPYGRWTTVRADAERAGDGGEAPPQTNLWARGLPSNLVNGLAVLQDGSVAVATSYGLGLVNSLGPDRRGSVISERSRSPIGYLLARFSLGKEQKANWGWQGLAASKPRIERGLPHSDAYLNAVEAVAQDMSGRLWLATRYFGLACMDPGKDRVTVFRKKHGPLRRTSATTAMPLESPMLAANLDDTLPGREDSWMLALEHAVAPKKDSPPKPKQPDIMGPPDDYVFAVAAAPDGSVWCGTYGGALARFGTAAGVVQREKSASAGSTDIARCPLPAAAGAPNAQELESIFAELSAIPFDRASRSYPFAVVYGDDWRTRGDWQGRYGQYGAVLCSHFRPNDGLYAQCHTVVYHRYIGGYHTREDRLRHWVHWWFTDNPNSLELPFHDLNLHMGMGATTLAKPRRQSEWDDHGETYPMSLDGPNTSFDIWAPEASMLMGLYFFNKDGHSGPNRFRDFRILVKQKHGEPRHERYFITAEEQATLDRQPVLAQARIRDFRNGAYKQFIVRGPGWYTVEIRRNHSFCTILSGVFLDYFNEADWCRLPGWKRPYDEDPFKEHVAREVTMAAKAATGERLAEAYSGTTDLSMVPLSEMWNAAMVWNPRWSAQRGRPIMAAIARNARSLAMQEGRSVAESGNVRNLGYACFHLQLFDEWEAIYRAQNRPTSRDAHQSLVNGARRTVSTLPKWEKERQVLCSPVTSSEA